MTLFIASPSIKCASELLSLELKTLCRSLIASVCYPIFKNNLALAKNASVKLANNVIPSDSALIAASMLPCFLKAKDKSKYTL